MGVVNTVQDKADAAIWVCPTTTEGGEIYHKCGAPAIPDQKD